MKTKNLAVSIIVGVLVVALWWTMLLKPTRSKVAKAKSDAKAQEAKLAPLQADLAKAQRDAAHAAEFKAELQSLQQAMPNTPALAAFIRDANGIASASGVAWQAVTHATPTPGVGGVMSITVAMQVQGTYGQVLDYLGRLASMKRLLVVDSVQLTTTTSGGTTGNAGGTNTSTGPFSGGSKLSATITGRMFATPAAVAATGTTGAAGATGAPASSSAPAAASSSR